MTGSFKKRKADVLVRHTLACAHTVRHTAFLSTQNLWGIQEGLIEFPSRMHREGKEKWVGNQACHPKLALHLFPCITQAGTGHFSDIQCMHYMTVTASLNLLDFLYHILSDLRYARGNTWLFFSRAFLPAKNLHSDHTSSTLSGKSFLYLFISCNCWILAWLTHANSSLLTSSNYSLLKSRGFRVLVCSILISEVN